MTGLIAFFSSLPAIIELLGKFGSLFQKMLQAAQNNNLNGWIDDLEKRIDNFAAAKTDSEKYAATKDLLNSIRNIGPG